MIEVTRLLATFVAQSSYERLPANVRHEGARAFVNWLGCAFNGCDDPAVEKAARALARLAGPGDASVVGRSEQFDVATAAYLNCLSTMVDSYNDTHLASICHPAGAVIASALAVAEQNGATGRDFIHAAILGIEVTCRVSNILSVPPGRCHVGINMSGYTTGIGAAAAVGKLLALNAGEIAWALDLAATRAAGFRHGSGAMTAMTASPNAAHAGVVSALLAAEGFTGTEQGIEGRNGLGDTIGDPPNYAAAIEALGERFEILTDMPKPFPCGVVVHPIIDGCLQLARTGGFVVDDVASVALAVAPMAIELAGKKEPKTAADAINSLYHWAAAALLRGHAGLAEGREDCVADPRVVALRGRVSATPDSALADDAARVTLTLKDGAVRHAAIEHCSGSALNPMSDGDLNTKFGELVEAHLTAADAAALREEGWGVEGIGNVADFVASRLRAAAVSQEGKRL